MLISLRIENFALIDRLELEFAPGLNVLTGETGAGKSIILDAIDIVLGGKVSSRMLRTGRERALLEASFKLTREISDWLSSQEIDLLEDAALLCSREISQTVGGLRSRSRLNGVVVNRQQLEDLRDRLVAITAQGQAVQLLQATTQRQWLDRFGGDTLLAQRQHVTSAFSQFQQTQQALEQYWGTERQRLQQLDVLEYQLRELQQAELTVPEEQTSLEQEQHRLSHSVDLQQQSYQVYQILYEQEEGLACGDLLGQAVTLLTEMSQFDEQVKPLLEMAENALTQVEEVGRQIHSYADSLEADPQRLQEVDARLTQLKQICRKFGPTLAEAIAYQQQIEQQLQTLTAGEQSLEILQQQFQQADIALKTACEQLTQLRSLAARALETRLLDQLKPLAMERVQFQVQLQPIPPTAQGAELIQFFFSPNPGEPLQPLSETASGGEMSRFLLALRACFAQVDPVATLVFDEIDVGVSGRVTQAIATQLHHLSQHHQVLCVTHQPIVAAMADLHLRVEKIVQTVPSDPQSPYSEPETERTVVRASVLDPQQRRQELAQLAGGRSGEQAIAFAESLLHQADSLRQPPVAPERKRHKAKTGKRS